jgi:hypothetical protein
MDPPKTMLNKGMELNKGSKGERTCTKSKLIIFHSLTLRPACATSLVNLRTPKGFSLSPMKFFFLLLGEWCQ